MSSTALTTARVRNTQTPFSMTGVYRKLLTSPIQTFYPGAMLGYITSGSNAGLVDKLYDTNGASGNAGGTMQFCGLVGNDLQIILSATSLISDPNPLVQCDLPQFAQFNIASANAATDFGKKVYALWDDYVSYSTGSNGYLVGHVEEVINSTAVKVRLEHYQVPDASAVASYNFQVNTAITTVGAGTLTAAAIVGGMITRTGPTGAFTDTTDTASAITATLPAQVNGQAWIVTIKNTTNFVETLAGGMGVTLSGQTIIPANSTGFFLFTSVTPTTATMVGQAIVTETTSPEIVNTAITTVGAGTLTAAGMVGGVITRSGSTGAYSDATDTAAAIIAALPNGNVGQSWILRIKNTVAFTQTITNGMGVTLSGQTLIPPLSVGTFLVTMNGLTTCTMVGLEMAPMTTPPILAQGTLTTVGAGTVLGATIADGLLLRTGPTSAFTDTTDAAANIAAAIPNIQIGESFLWTYQNSSYSVATLAGGTGVASAATFATVGPGCWATYLFTYTATNTFSVAQVQAGHNWIGLPPVSYSTGTTTTTFTAGEMTGGELAVYTSTAATPGSIATATATAMFAAIQGAYVGLSWIFRVINDAATNSLTVTADASVTLSGKTTYVATPYGSMDFLMTFTSPTAATMKYIGGGQSTTV